MLDIKNSEDKQVKEIQNSNGFIGFVDDILEAREEISIFDMSGILGDSFLFPNVSQHSFFKTNDDDKDLENYLINTYIDNDNKPINISKDKNDIISHFEDYFICNHENLNEYRDVVTHTSEYNLLAYTIYKTLVKIYPKFKELKEPFKINSIMKSDLLYKISVEFPDYVKVNQLVKYDYLFEEEFKSRTKGDVDLEVRVVIEKINENIVFTVSRFTNKNSISIADILNFGIGYSYSDMLSDKYKTPLVLGLLDNESPKILDFNDSKNIAIVGAKGKCPIAYSFVTNLVTTTHYEDLNMVICSQRDNTFWKMFSRNPHVLGYHTDSELFKDIINDIYDESEKRLKIAKRKKIKDFNNLKKHLKNESQILLVLDGLSKILTNYRTILKNASESNYVHLLNMLNSIAKHAHITGVSILAISERGDKSTFPQEIIKNSLVKIAMKDSSENDINTLFGLDTIDLSRPIGLDYNLIEYNDLTPRYCRTSSIGGLNDKQMLSIVRVIAFDWIRKSIFSDISIIEQPKGLNFIFAYNRNEIASDSISKIVDGKVIPSW